MSSAGATKNSSTSNAELKTPRVSAWRVRWFTAYVRRYLLRSFHSVRLASGTAPGDLPREPTLVYINHPSWWDPLFCIVLAKHLFPDRVHYAPMDADALRRYRFFGKLGFFGVEPGTQRGALTLLRMGTEILSHDDAVLWITPQGAFTDPRQRPVRFMRGTGHLLARVRSCVILPIALEYPFWEERTPEALARCGALLVREPESDATADTWTERLEKCLERTQDALADDSIRRDAEAFTTILRGKAGVGGIYDMWRRFTARLRGKSFRPEHGSDKA